MSYTIKLSPAAINDIDAAFEYYNISSCGLGFEFAKVIDDYFSKNFCVACSFCCSLRRCKGKAC